MGFINDNTFILDANEKHKGTVLVTLRGETRRVRAWISSDCLITAYGITGRYKTGGKAWPAEISQHEAHDGTVYETVWFGRDDRNGKFKKADCLHFAQEGE